MSKFFEWIGTIITLSGAVLTTLGIDPLNIYIMNIGSLIWVIWAILERKFGILIVNLGLLLIYVYGIIIRNFEIKWW